MANTFYFFTDSQNHLLEVFIVGSVLSYIAVIFNIFIFLILFRKNFLSPATIVMQGLSLADCLTAFCSYGLEPLLQTYFECDPVLFWPHNYAVLRFIPYPSCWQLVSEYRKLLPWHSRSGLNITWQTRTLWYAPWVVFWYLFWLAVLGIFLSSLKKARCTCFFVQAKFVRQTNDLWAW